MTITKHSKERMVERTSAETFAQAKKMAKQAMVSGKHIGYYQGFPDFYNYLKAKQGQTNTCMVKVYRGCLYIWKGKNKSLVTAHPIPDRFKDEIDKI